MSLQEDLHRLNEQQKAIVKKFSKPSLVVAGPGTGKTRTVSVLIGNLLKHGTRLKEVLALTFSDKAARELKERVLEYFPESFDECWISTFHSFCARILREQYFRIFIKPDFKLLTGFKEALLMSGICRRQDPGAFKQFGRVLYKRGFQQEILTFISLLKSNLISSDNFCSAISTNSAFSERIKSRLEEISALYKLYEQERTKTGYLDFRDLISLTVKLFQIPEVARLYRNRFQVILVDEFQDTDPAQYLLLKLLKGDETRSRVAVIGDPRQSIYRFRGADPGMMTYKGPFSKEFSARIFPLQKNYRCAKEIIDVATKLDWQEKTRLDKSLEACNLEKGFVKLYKVKDELEEARFLCRKIAGLLIYGETRKFKPEEIALLVRNNYQIDLIAENLQALHIPFNIAGDMKFFKSEEVIVLASLLKIAAFSGNEKEEALIRIFGSRIFALKPLWVQAVLAKITPVRTLSSMIEQMAENEFDSLPQADEEMQIRAAGFAETIKLLADCKNQPLQIVIARLMLFLQNSFEDLSKNSAKNAIHFRNMIADYCELFKRLNQKEALVSDLMPEFDEWLTYYASTLELEDTGERSGVKIMTVHQSKGLEFPVVVIPGLCEGQFPVKLRENLLVDTQSIEKLKAGFDKNRHQVSFFNPYPLCHQDHLEEERRLFYVALTRAKEGVMLSYPLRQGTDPVMPAPYLKECGLLAVEPDIEQRPLTLSEFRIKLGKLQPETLNSLETELVGFDSLINESLSVHGIRPRVFSVPVSDSIKLPENFAFSASSLKNYIDCPRRFFFLNILKIKNPLMLKQSWFQTGNAYHAILEELHRPGSIWEKGKKPSEDDLKKLFSDFAAPFLEELDFFQRHQESESIVASLPDYVNAIYGLGQFPPAQTAGVEHQFGFELNGYKITGRFDRLVLTDYGYFVIDYKTTARGALNSKKIYERAFLAEALPQEIQMPLYLLACRQNNLDPVCAALLYIRQEPYKRGPKGFEPGFLRSACLNYGFGPEFGIDITNNDLDKFADKIAGVINEISNTSVFACKPSSDKEARTCLNFDQNKKPKCEFFPFCQEQLEELRQERFSEE
jgi:DNA helicase-2/ATP-dependent DNA helicase PcrA